MDNLAKYNAIFSNIFSVPQSALGDAFVFGKVPGWDSVAHLSLISELEDAFDVLFESDDILHYGSYENGKCILRRYGVDI